MHEMSIAMGIVDIATKACNKASKKCVAKITLEIGGLAGVQLEALDFVWPIAVKNSVLENAVKEVRKISGEANCLECHNAYPIKNYYDNCPLCGSYLKNITKGKELSVLYIEV